MLERKNLISDISKRQKMKNPDCKIVKKSVYALLRFWGAIGAHVIFPQGLDRLNSKCALG